MNTSNHLWPLASSVHSGARPANSKIISWVCAVLLAGLALCGGSAKAAFTPYNVLVNPGAETGDLTGWNISPTGYIAVVSTNSLVPNTTNEDILAHSGQYVFEMANTTANRTYMYQDFPAVAGSQWSASVWAICYASNYLQPGVVAFMQVAFYDTNNNVIASTNSSDGLGGVYGTDFLDPVDWSGLGIFWTIIPPPAVDATGWLCLTPTNLYSTDPATEGSYDFSISPITNLTAPAGTAFVRYQLELDNTGTGGGAVYWDDCVLQKLNQTDPDITNPQPASVTIYPGESVSFTVHAVKQLKSEVLTYQWQKNGTNLPPNGGVGHIAGATTNATLYFTNSDCGSFDDGSYTCVVSDSAGSITTLPATLTVLLMSPLQHANALGPNYGFELAPVWFPWIPFGGCYFDCATNITEPAFGVVPFDGNWCAMVGANGDRDNGFYQIVPVDPGSVWKAGGWAYISSFNDFVGYNTCRLQCWFVDSSEHQVPGTPVYESFKIYGTNCTPCCLYSPGTPNLYPQLPRDQWCWLPVTNVVNNGGIGCCDDLPYATLTNGVFTVPTNAAYICFQVYEYCPVSSDGLGYVGTASDAVYWDDMVLVQIVPPAALTASVSGANVNLSFGAGAGLIYSVLYKTNLTDATWGVLTNVAAPPWWQTTPYNCNTNPYPIDYYPITVSDPVAAQSRFYRVQVQ